jgi:Beta-galactosidase
MEPVWPKLVAGNLNSVPAAVSWAQTEPEEGKFDFAVVDGLIERARANNLRLIFLWFGSWKNGFSSYAPIWVKRDFTRFPRIQIYDGKQSKTIELLSTFGDATRAADAAAFAALMEHIKKADGARHTVLMMQVENEVGVLRDSRDRSPAANQAFSQAVPRELMSYLESHKETMGPELRGVWAANGSKKSGTWEQVFGPGKPQDVEIPVQTKSPPLSPEEYEAGWKTLHWAADEVFMAWHYSRFIEKVIEEGKAEYNIPMYANAWLQQPNMAWPGTYPSGGPLPQVQDLAAGRAICRHLGSRSLPAIFQRCL